MYVSSPFDHASNSFVFVVELDPLPKSPAPSEYPVSAVDAALTASGFRPGRWVKVPSYAGAFRPGKPDIVNLCAYSFGRGVHRSQRIEGWEYKPVPILLRSGDGYERLEVALTKELIEATSNADSELALLLAQLRVMGENHDPVIAKAAA
jgi:hypothetical protein